MKLSLIYSEQNTVNMTEAHYLSMVLIGVGSFIFGILPMAFSFRVARAYPFFLSLVLCLGAGVLLATSLVHMLTEVQIKLKLSAQLYFCGGFLTLYTFDEITHYFLNNKQLELQLFAAEGERDLNKRSSYGATWNSIEIHENFSSLETNERQIFENIPNQKQFDGNHSYFSRRSSEEKNARESQESLLNAHSHLENNAQNQVPCSLEEKKHWSPNSTTKTGLLIALLIHSILEGISVGVQTKVSQILLILGAVMFHKVVLSFCLGLELHNHGFKISHLLAAIFFFSIGSPIGILLGMTVTSLESGIFGIDAQLQAVAAGSLLYVAAFELLPRERFKWQHNSNRKAAGILQLIFVLVGFTCITVFHFFVDSLFDGGHAHIVNATRKFG